MGLDLMPRLHHGVGHGLKDGGVAAGVHGGHGHALQEGELLHGERLVEVLALDVEADVVVGDGGAVVAGGAEVHAGSVVVLVVDDVHLVVPVVLDVVLLLLEVPALQHHDLLLAFLDHLVLDLHRLGLLQGGVESPAAEVLLEQQVLLPLVEVLASELLVLGGLPLPAIADLDEVVARPLELVGRQLARLLEHVLLRRRTPLLADLLRQVVGDVLAPIPPAHQINISSSCTELRIQLPAQSTKSYTANFLPPQAPQTSRIVTDNDRIISILLAILFEIKVVYANWTSKACQKG